MMQRIAGSVAIMLLAACAGAPGPDTILVNGKVFTASPSQPWAEAVAISGDRITAVGDTATIAALARDNTRRLDLGGRTVIPGINDAHAHLFVMPPHQRLTLPFDATLEQIAEGLRAQLDTAPPGTWIEGEFGGNAWDRPEFTREWLDAMAPRHPVRLTSFTGHGAVLNSQALARVDITDQPPAVEGGVFGRDAQGRLNGRLEEYAQSLVHRRLAEQTAAEDVVRRYRDHAAEAITFGITSTQLLGDYVPTAYASKALVAAGAPMRWRYFRFPIGVDGVTLESKPPLPPQPSPLIDMRGMKWILDGTLVERWGYNRAPYADRPAERGRLNLSPQRIEQFVGWAYGSEDPLAVHAFGDAAIETYVAAIEKGGRPEVWKAKRPRIEHADMTAPDLIPRVKAAGMVIVQNPTHFTVRDIFAARYGAERMAWIQPMKSLVDAGIPLAIGSDGPINPFLNIMAAVTHPTNPKEALTREQAVIAYTTGSAFAEFKEKEKGQIAIGMLADLAVLSADLFTVPEAELESIRSVMTLVGGRVVYESGVVR